MNRKIPPPFIKAIVAGTILLLPIFVNSMINYSYAQNESGPIPLPIPHPKIPSPVPTPSPGLLGTLKVITKVSGGNKMPSDFTIAVYGNSPKPASFAGSSSGTTVTLKSGKYSVSESSIPGYSVVYSSECSGSISVGRNINLCTVTNHYSQLGSLTFLNVITKVDNTNGGTKKPSDFIITVSGNSPSPRIFSGASSGTAVTLKTGMYSISESSIPGYTTRYSSACYGTATGGVPIKCIVSNQYSLVGSLTFLNVITKVDNTNGGTKKPSDFIITVSGNCPSPRIFSGSSSGTSVRLGSGDYEVTENSMPDYSASYSPACYGTATGGVPIKCVITNQYYVKSAPPSPVRPNEPPNITITSNSNSVYSIPSTFVKVDRFSKNYTIAGEISSINASKDLITSTIVDDFDKNPNIGYIVRNGSFPVLFPVLLLLNPVFLIHM